MNDEQLVFACIGVGLVVLTSAFVALRRSAREREMRHTERLRALEHGLVLDELDEERRIRGGMLKLAAGLGIVVPISIFACAAAAIVNMPTQAPFAIFLIWTGAAAVGVAAVASGAWLAQAAIARFGHAGRRERHPVSANPLMYETSELAAVR